MSLLKKLTGEPRRGGDEMSRRWFLCLAFAVGAAVFSVGYGLIMLTSQPALGLLASVAALAGATILLGLFLYRRISQQLAEICAQQAQTNALISLQTIPMQFPAPWSPWAISPLALHAIVVAILEADAHYVVECGSGVSTLYLASVLRHRNVGHLYSLEEDPEWASYVRHLASLEGLADWVTVIDVELEEQEILGRCVSWYGPAALHFSAGIPIDALVVDGPKGKPGEMRRLGAVPRLWDVLSDACLVFLHDATRPEEKEILTEWQRHFPLEVHHLRAPADISCLRRR